MFEKIKIKLLIAHDFLIQINKFKLIILAVITNLIISLLFSFISNIVFGEKSLNGFKNIGSLSNELVMVVFIAPLFETILFQYGIIEIVRKRFNPFVCCCISSFVFASMHTYNVFYFFFAFLGGLLFGYLYFIGKSVKMGILLVFFVHIIYNSLVFMIKHLGTCF